MARKASGFSLRKLAEAVGLSQTAINKYEKDINSPDSANLLLISEATGFPIEFFFRQENINISKPEFRKLSRLGKKDEERILTKTHEWLERYLTVESFFPNEFSGFENISFETALNIEEKAVKLREFWKLGLDPIESIVEVIEDNGIKVLKLDEVEEFNALTFYYNQEPIVVFNGNNPVDRQVFSIAHELGHLVLGETDQKEKDAHRFAAAFLVPKSQAIKELGRKRNNISLVELKNLKTKYKMSMSAWVRRAYDLNIITNARFRSFMINFSREGYRKKEPELHLCPETPIRMENLIFRALGEEIISESKAAELLNRPISPIERTFLQTINEKPVI